MPVTGCTRRGLLFATAAMAGGAAAEPRRRLVTLHTFGDSVLDCGHYNPHGVHPGGLLVRNDDQLFPDFQGQDASARGPARLDHRAVDGATVDSLASQLRGFRPGDGPSVCLLTVGGNDLLRGLAGDNGPGLRAFESTLNQFLRSPRLPPVLIGTVYDPTFGDDSRNFLGTDARTARANHRRVNEVLGNAATYYGRLVDVHAHFLKGDPSWFIHTIEPSLRGASEVRAAFWPAVEVQLPGGPRA